MIELLNAGGCRAVISPQGCTLVSLWVRDRDDELVDVVLGYDDEAAYREDEFYLGCVVGPYAGRIDRGRFSLDSRPCQLSADSSGHHLHGGAASLNRRRWEVLASARDRVTLTCATAAGEGGYPAGLSVAVTYCLTDQDEFWIEYRATADALTVVNLTHHAYFNLAGHDAGDILDHELQINAGRFAGLRPDLIPTGELLPVERSPLDFRMPARIGDRIDTDHETLRHAGGYDHTWLVEPDCMELQKPAAGLHAATSGISMRVYTDQPGIQFYSGNGLPASWLGKRGARYGHRQGLCLETQHLPDSPNHAAFPSTQLHPGEIFRSRTRLKFAVNVLNPWRHGL